MSNRPLTIGLVAGETSGDILGAGLIRALKAQIPDARFVGVAGPLMQAEGCEARYEMEELAVMGVVEVLERLPRLLKIRRISPAASASCGRTCLSASTRRTSTSRWKAASSSAASAPFTTSALPCGPAAKARFQNWQSHRSGAGLSPFRKAFYDRFNVPCRFIGHTMADAMPLQPDRLAARAQLGIDPQARCLALLPGSRGAEVEMLSADFLKTAQLLRMRYPELEVVVPLVNAKRREQFERIKAEVAPDLTVHLLNGRGARR